MRLHNKGVAAGLAAAMSTAAVGMLAATSPVVASAAAPPKVVTVTLGGGKIALGSTSIPAGNVVFAVKSTKGDHTMQVLQLHAGYSQNQAQHDINAAFGGNKAAIKRVDTKIDWLGGDDATPQKPSQFSTGISRHAHNCCLHSFAHDSSILLSRDSTS